MTATIIDGKGIAGDIKSEVKHAAARLKRQRGIVPGLAFILVGDDPASQAYVHSKGKACEEIGFYSVTERRPAAITQQDLAALVRTFNKDTRIHGILVQLPLPRHLNEEAIIEEIDWRKDVD